MTDLELKQLKENLWHAADVLRAGAHLAANKYGQPILGLIFLRYADILFKQHKEEIEAEYEKLKNGRMAKTIKEIAVEKCGFYLPECAYYDFINNSPDDANKAVVVKKAMQAIEDENPKMSGVLPKEVYAGLVPEEEPELLSNIVRIFKDIPETSTVDIFGEIYEYFLGNFALAEGKDGGTFYTPATVVRYMVEVLSPEPGDKKFLDKTISRLIRHKLQNPLISRLFHMSDPQGLIFLHFCKLWHFGYGAKLNELYIIERTKSGFVHFCVRLEMYLNMWVELTELLLNKEVTYAEKVNLNIVF